MDEAQTKNIIEAALLAAGRPLPLDKLLEIFKAKGHEIDRAAVRAGVAALAADYETRGIEVKEVASGFRVQVRSGIRDWLDPLFEERAPRYTRALLETLALIAYRQPITRAEIEEVRGVTVSPNIVRTLMERGWIRVVGYRDVPGKPSMLGTTREFLDYFGLKRLDDLPPLADIKEGLPELSPQSDFLEALEEVERARAGLEVAEEQPMIVDDDAAEPAADATEALEADEEAEPVETAALRLVSEQSSS